MFKNVKKALFALLLAFVAAFAFACGKSEEVKEANKENCKEFCEACPTPEECEKCNNASAETCKDFCPAAPACNEASAETCKKFQDFIAPTSFFVDGEAVEVGSTKKVFIDDEMWEPEGCDTTLVFVSADPTIATVDAQGVVTGVRPGKVNILVYSPLNPEVVKETVEFVVKDAEKDDLNVTERELNAILAQLPKFVSETTELPGTWNLLAKVSYTIGTTTVDKLEVAADLAEDTLVKLKVTVTLNDASSDSTVDVWLVKNNRVNTFVVLDSVAALIDNYLAKYVNGEKLAQDLELPENIYGCAIKWTSSQGSALSAAGKYTAQSEDKNIELGALLQYGTGSKNLTYKFVAKGYSPEEKADAIMASTFGKMAGKEFNTSIVLPEYDDLFGAKLTYTSQDTAVYDNTGKLVAPVTEAKDVKFTVKIAYSIAKNAADNFEVEKELTIKAVPTNAAATELEGLLNLEANKKYQSVVHAPWGKEAGNIVFPALPGMVWDVEAVKLDARLQEGYQVFTQSEAGLKLEAQYLRYQLVSIKGTYTKGDDSTNVVLFFNIGVSDTPVNIITGIWRTSAQNDTTLSPEQGLYDFAGNVSFFDKKVGYVTQTYGSGYWSGWSVAGVDANGKTWQAFLMEVMTVYIREDANGVYIDPANVNGGIAGAGGNWGVWYVNTTDKEVNIEVGVYGTAELHYAEGHETASSVGSRLNIAMDGYALGFVADKDGKIIHGSNNTKLQDGMSDKRAVLGGKTYKADEKISEVMYNAIQLEGKETKFAAVYTATENLLFVQNNEGTFKKEVEGEVTTYVAIKEGEEVAEADRFAPTYAKGAVLTAEQFAALDEETAKLVTLEYKALAAVEYVVPNLFGDSAKGSVVNYLTIPANGYAMSWKYQFYGMGDPASLYALCQDDETLTIDHYQVHPLSSMDAEYATNYVVAAEDLLKEAEFKHADFEANVNAARVRYDKLSGDTLADVFPAARLTTLEAKAAELIDADITALLASEPAADADKAEFAKGLATMWARLYKTEDDKVVNRLSAQITGALTKKADFDAKYAEYAAIDLHITYDYDGGYIQGFWKDTDKEAFLAQEFMPALYAFMVEKGAWAEGTAPTYEVFSSIENWSTNYSKNEATELSKFLFTPKVELVGEEEVVHNDYHDIIEGSDKFVNTEAGHKFIALIDYVNESCQTANGNGQDVWGRKGETYVPQEWIQRQSYATAAMVNTNLDKVVVTNRGPVLGAYRFAQWVCGIGQANYKSWMPNNVWSNIFDRQYTQEHNVQVYHCTDLTVKLQDEPYKEGYKFLGWKFANGEDAVITGSMFADVTVYAAWAPSLEDSIEAALNTQLEGVFYGPTTDTRYTKATDTGTIADQVNTVGLGDYAIITNGKLFVMPKYAGIELGKDATADVTLDTKESVQVYGTDGTTQFSCGLVIGASGAEVRNSYGHGALYHNASEQFNVTITEVKNTYGRNLGGAAYGYDRFLFHYDTEKQIYVGTKVSAADGTSVTLAPGDFLWCPMTADRFCSGLTNCDGTSGVVGVWNGIEAPEAQIISTKAYLPVESPEWFTVKFLNEDGTIAKAYYDVADIDIVAPVLEKPYYQFLGWAETADATEAATVDAKISRNVTYYPVFKLLDLFDTITVDPDADESPANYKTLATAVSKAMDNAVITVKAGTYDEELVIDRPVTILGPNANVKGYRTRAAEALFTGSIKVADGVNGLVINGMAFGGDDSKYLTEEYTGNSNKCKILFEGKATGNNDTLFTCNYVTAGRVVLEFGLNENTVISNNFFNWTSETAQAYSYWRPIRADKVSTNFSFNDNVVVQTVANDGSTGFYDTFYLGNAKGETNVRNNHITFNCYNWAFNIAASSGTINVYNNVIEGADSGDGKEHGAGFAVEGSAAETVLNIIGNKFIRTAGTTFSAKTCPTVNVKFNDFEQNGYKPRLLSTATITHEKNYVKAAAVTAVSGYATITLDNDFTDKAAYDAAVETLAGSMNITKFAGGYVNGKELYLSKSYAFNAYYIRKLAVKYNDATGEYVVVGSHDASMKHGIDFDFIIALHDAYETDGNKAAYKALLEGAKAGDRVEFVGKTFDELNAYSSTAAVTIEVKLYTSNK